MADIMDEGFDDMPAPAVPQPVAPKAKNKSVVPGSDAQKRVKIIIGEGDAQDDPFVFVQVNGVAYKIMRGEEVSVPEAVKHVLDNAIVTVSVKGSDGKMRPRKQMRFPYQFLGEAA